MVRQGILAKAWLGTGEEAVTIGNVHALNRQIDKVGPMIRNAGACHEMGMSVADMLREYWLRRIRRVAVRIFISGACSTV
jgi:TPP-dependent pyruvate/acetoin dehydrogenase alpha subunit